MEKILKPVNIAEFQEFLLSQANEGIRFAPAREEILDTEHIWSYIHPQTGEVCALVEVPRDERGQDIMSEKVFYILS